MKEKMSMHRWFKPIDKNAVMSNIVTLKVFLPVYKARSLMRLLWNIMTEKVIKKKREGFRF